MPDAGVERLKAAVRGAVQGVGFRPFVYRLAMELNLAGWVQNSAQGVFLEVEGARAALEFFVLRLQKEKPPRAIIEGFEFSFLDAVGFACFEIRESSRGGEKTALITPDIATCQECLREIFDPLNRRYRYPFTNCTHCGPRFTIIEALPYDRPHTSMKKFALCELCSAEYRDPLNRRFHAQPNACPDCGPQVQLWSAEGGVTAERDDALLHAAQAVRSGAILALKGIGGFQLIADARNHEAVLRLRARKHRDEKPFAVMLPSLPCAQELCRMRALEERLLLSPEAPIVLLEKSAGASLLSPAVAPAHPTLGVMLPYSPLHHLLMRELGFPIVATSGNLSGEPICTDERDALARLSGIADAFLAHDRPIVRHTDDSVVRVMLGRELMLRRARGYAPLPVQMKKTSLAILAVGAHQKNTIALSMGSSVFISQHIGDLETQQAFQAFRDTQADFLQLYGGAPVAIACDLHPDYLSTKFARASGLPVEAVQHHYAHALACMAENELEPPLLAICWDGTGWGPDGTIWGGEFLRIDERSFERCAHLRTFRLPGGAAAVREPRRCALGLLYEIFGDAAFDRATGAAARNFSVAELTVLRRALPRNLNAPVTSSAGRLFDAVASLLGLRQFGSFEGQAATELENAAQIGIEESYPIALFGSVVDWEPAIRALLADASSTGVIAAKFHNTLVDAIVQVAHRAGERNVALTGGCFQNRYLAGRAVMRLRAEGFSPYWHQRVPPNDGGIALGQVLAAARALDHRAVQASTFPAQ